MGGLILFVCCHASVRSSYFVCLGVAAVSGPCGVVGGNHIMLCYLISYIYIYIYIYVYTYIYIYIYIERERDR